MIYVYSLDYGLGVCEPIGANRRASRRGGKGGGSEYLQFVSGLPYARVLAAVCEHGLAASQARRPGASQLCCVCMNSRKASRLNLAINQCVAVQLNQRNPLP